MTVSLKEREPCQLPAEGRRQVSVCHIIITPKRAFSKQPLLTVLLLFACLFSFGVLPTRVITLACYLLALYDVCTWSLSGGRSQGTKCASSSEAMTSICPVYSTEGRVLGTDVGFYYLFLSVCYVNVCVHCVCYVNVCLCLVWSVQAG